MLKNWPLAIALSLCLAACAGTKFSFDDARRVQVGMTEAQLQEILGAPTAVVARGDQVVWVWSYADAFTGSRSVSFVLKDGVVATVPNLPATYK